MRIVYYTQLSIVEIVAYWQSCRLHGLDIAGVWPGLRTRRYVSFAQNRRVFSRKKKIQVIRSHLGSSCPRFLCEFPNGLCVDGFIPKNAFSSSRDTRIQLCSPSVFRGEQGKSYRETVRGNRFNGSLILHNFIHVFPERTRIVEA